MALGILKQPVRRTPTPSGCIGCHWFRYGYAVPYVLSFNIDLLSQAYNAKIRLQLASRPQVGNGCSGSDTYVFADSIAGYVDVWGAYRNSVWDSSVVITVSALATTTHASRLWVQFGELDINSGLMKNITVSAAAVACANYVQVATVTIGANGSISLA